MAAEVRSKRIYVPAEPGDGYRVLVDHIWPRGVSLQAAQIDEWLRELAPSDGLRKWFDHVPARFPEFRSRYRAELRAKAQVLARLRRQAASEPLTIVYAARDEEHNNAVVVEELLRDG